MERLGLLNEQLRLGVGACTSRDVELARGNGDAYNHTFTGQINVTGGFGNGTSNASNTVTVPCRAYHTPHTPKNIRAERLSDTSAKISWDVDYTGMNGDYPWSTVTVGVVKNGSGKFTDVGTVSWDTTSHTYNGLEPGCMYIFSAKATGPGGTSDYGVSAPAIYTTPTALGMLEAVKAEAAKVVLKGHDAPAFVDSWEFQLTTDGGKTWVDADVMRLLGGRGRHRRVRCATAPERSRAASRDRGPSQTRSRQYARRSHRPSGASGRLTPQVRPR